MEDIPLNKLSALLTITKYGTFYKKVWHFFSIKMWNIARFSLLLHSKIGI